MTTPSLSPEGRESEDYGEILIRAGLQPANQTARSPADQWKGRNTAAIVAYLEERVPEFCTLEELRRKGWENPHGDTHFNRQRQNADKTDAETSKIHFRVMKRVGDEIQRHTEGFGGKTFPGRILDMCASPGGFLAIAARYNPGCKALAFSLPPSKGGYEFLFRQYEDSVEFLDVTMLAGDMGVTDIPADHSDAANFLPRRIDKSQVFDLAICDGHVLRTHAPNRAAYREASEGDRLKTAQLAISLEHLVDGGTMVVLLHKVEAWDTASLIRRFSRFSNVVLYKPKRDHATRGSFYMVAKSVRPHDAEAILAIDKWKAVWRAATFGTYQEYEDAIRQGEPTAEELLGDFGTTLVEKAKSVWVTQTTALANAPYIRNN